MEIYQAIVLGIVFIQKRTLEIIIEANGADAEKSKKAKVNIKSLIFNKKIFKDRIISILSFFVNLLFLFVYYNNERVRMNS